MNKTLKEKLRRGLFGPLNTNNDISFNQLTSITSGFYNGKPVPFVYNKDLAVHGGMGVSYHITPVSQWDSSIQLSYAEDETLARMLNYGIWRAELRIVLQNHRSTNRGHKTRSAPLDHPAWQITECYTPWDLNDVGSILGYRNSAQIAYREAWPTFPSTPGVTGYAVYPTNKGTYTVYSVNDLLGLPSVKDNHPVLRENNKNFYTGWGYPSIFNGGHSKLTLANNTPFVPTDFTRHWGGSYPTGNTLGFAAQGITGSFTETLDLQAQSISSGHFFPHLLNWQVDRSNYLYTMSGWLCSYDYSVQLTYNDIAQNGKTGTFWFNIIDHAMKQFYHQKNNEKLFNYLDTFNYTLAVVFYVQTADNKWVIEDIIFDRLRTIDKWDVEHYNYLSPDDTLPYNTRFDSTYLDCVRHPNVCIVNSECTWNYGGNTAYFKIDSDWWHKYFDSNLDFQHKDSQWILDQMYIVACPNSGTDADVVPLNSRAFTNLQYDDVDNKLKVELYEYSPCGTWLPYLIYRQ